MGKGRNREQGIGLAAVLIMALVLGTLLTTLIGANTSTLAVVRHSEGSQLAQSAAESLIARAIYELKKDPSFGCDDDDDGSVSCISFSSKTSDSGQAQMTFSTTEAVELGIPVSVNNLENAESVLGPDGDLIPARTARISAVGTFGSERRTVVMDLHIPPYPYAVATDGTFESMGKLTLSGLSADTGEEIPGHLMANSTSSSALSLGTETHISGDLVSAGGIVYDKSDESIKIDGEERSNSKPADVPKIPIADYDPRTMTTPGTVTTLGSSFYGSPTLEGKVLREGDLMISGEMNLDGALLFVDGDLEINGELSGRGAIVTTGQLLINGTQSLTTDNELALLVGGDLSIHGRGVNSSKLEGLIYSEGNVEVRDSTIQGTLISRSNGGTTPQVVLERVNMVHDSKAASFESSVTSTEVSATTYLAFNSAGLYAPGLTTTEKPQSLETTVLAAVSTAEGAVADLGGVTLSTAASADSAAPAKARSAAPAPTLRAAPVASGETLYIGVTVDGKGDYLVFPPDGSEPQSSRSELGAMLKLAGIILNERPELRPAPGGNQIPWADLGAAVQALSKDLKAVQASVASSEATVVESTTQATETFDINIDPMKFLKYGEEMRVRAIRVLETSPSRPL